jgi:ABC-type phosphate/phosphonate transport system substrate-binding protein
VTGLCFLCLVAAPAVCRSGEHPSTVFPKTFHFGVLGLLNGVNQKDARLVIELNLVRDNKEQFPDMKVHVDIVPDVATAARLFDRQQLHGIVLTSSDYLALKERSRGVTPLFISSHQERLLESYVLLVSKHVADIDQLSTLERRRLVMESAGETNIGQLWLDTILWEHGKGDSRSFFSNIRKEFKAARTVLPVFFGQAEACLVPESVFHAMAELNPQIAQRLKVLKRSPGFAGLVTCTLKNLDPKLVAAMKHNAFTLSDSVAGRQLQMIFQYRYHRLYAPQYLEATERIYRIYKKESSRRRSTGATR